MPRLNYLPPIPENLSTTVTNALAEDIGTGDISAQLIPAKQTAKATLWCREEAVLCGTAWVNEVFRQLDRQIIIEWQAQDSDLISTNSLVATLTGNARSLLSGERTALNFLQTLSGTATTAYHYDQQLHQDPLQPFAQTLLLDTRKTLPCLRTAQKYAVACGGCHNHRMGLYDAFLIKENHIAAAGSIAKAVTAAKNLAPDKPVQVEVESLDELQQALDAGVDMILLDNFSIEQLHEAVKINQQYFQTQQSANPQNANKQSSTHQNQRVLLEASGGIDIQQLRSIAATGVDRISLGALTKHLHAIDLSLRFQMN